ncbi:MAG: hypothetical protein QM765_34060 [Myxococcales bacterium]
MQRTLAKLVLSLASVGLLAGAAKAPAPDCYAVEEERFHWSQELDLAEKAGDKEGAKQARTKIEALLGQLDAMLASPELDAPAKRQLCQSLEGPRPPRPRPPPRGLERGAGRLRSL